MDTTRHYSSAEACHLADITYRQLPDTFTTKIAVGPTPEGRPELGPCVLWTGACGAGGYGLLTARRQPFRAHVVAYEAVHGAVPLGLELDHLCRVKLCVRPAHLEAVTHAVNTQRHYAAAPTCKHGHRWTPENTYRRPSTGRRECRECNRVKHRSASR